MIPNPLQPQSNRRSLAFIRAVSIDRFTAANRFGIVFGSCSVPIRWLMRMRMRSRCVRFVALISVFLPAGLFYALID